MPMIRIDPHVYIKVRAKAIKAGAGSDPRSVTRYINGVLSDFCQLALDLPDSLTEEIKQKLVTGRNRAHWLRILGLAQTDHSL